eukprot:s3723_g6.t1
MPPKSAVPKYTIRVGLIWLVPSISLLLGCFHLIPLLLAALLTPLEVPKIRAKLFGNRAKKLLPCLRVPALLRLSVLWLLQVWFIILWRASSPEVSDAGAAAAMGVIGDSIANLATDEVLQRISVVLPCAGEGQYALNTVRAVYESVPANILHEIIVVDDGSEPPLAESFLTRDVVNVYKVTIIRHAQTVGLIGAKKDGGDAATGDIVVFFDCHVAPQPGWHESFLRLIGENYRRIVTPVITDLDVGTWQQRGGNQGQAKCYLTWDADFKWFTSDDPYVPILSGGLLGISKRWWNETGGYDVEMVGWGGENLDQSLRSWLCGGEIMMAQDSFVAHMWRSSRDTRTKAHYKVQPGAAARNRLRAAVAWFGDFSQKLSSFPGLQYERRNADGAPWYGNLDNILEVKTRLGCKSFAWFMNRFKHVYEDGGLIPAETFRIERDGRCLTYEGGAGTSPDGKGTAVEDSALQNCIKLKSLVKAWLGELDWVGMAALQNGSVKLSRRVEAFPLAISELLTDSHFMQGSEVIRLRVAHAHTSMGISLQLTRRSARGNRFKMKLAWTQFLQAAFNRTCRNAAVALHLDVAKSTVRRMQIMVSSAFMNKQAHFLAKLAQWRLHEQPAGVIKHIKWDETQLQCSMNADKSDCRVRSTWQVLVCRMRVMILWPSGHNLVYRIVMPPVTLLATGAEHQYYALYHHPAYKCINGLAARAVEDDGGQQQHAEFEESTSDASFARKVSYFAEMFNGPSMNGAPMKVCSSSCVAHGQRHCKDRNDAVRKCVDALLGLFLRGMPAVPSPSKWSKLFGPLDFVFAGSLVHNWLSEIFCEAFKDMSFQEFAEGAATEDVDPRLVETLFHVVTEDGFFLPESALQHFSSLLCATEGLKLRDDSGDELQSASWKQELKFTTAFQSADTDFVKFAEAPEAESAANVLTD